MKNDGSFYRGIGSFIHTLIVVISIGLMASNAAAQSSAGTGSGAIKAEDLDATARQLAEEYDDTEFGDLLYNEASIATRLEVLRLLSKDTPSLLVFLQAISMGLGIDDVVDASIRYEPSKGRDFSQSALSILPIVPSSSEYTFAKYRLDDLDHDDPSKPYSAQQVVDRFFEDRKVLVPSPDWLNGQFHFRASASELLDLQKNSPAKKWYVDGKEPTGDRPVFVSLYQADKSIQIDGDQRIRNAMSKYGPDATVPVVFIFNRVVERSIDDLSYEHTVKGVQKAFREQDIMLTAAPEWEKGDHHFRAELTELYEIFEIPEQDDFEEEHWQRLLAFAKEFRNDGTSLLLVVMPTGEDEERTSGAFVNGQQYALSSDPRSEADLPYTPAGGSDDPSLRALIGNGIVLNRPDVVAALNALGATDVPVAFYYISTGRVKPFSLGPRGLGAIIEGAGAPPVNVGGGGGFAPPPDDCASPPCNNL